MRYRIETERLLLRPLYREDAKQMFDTWASDPNVCRYLSWSPHKDISVTEYLLGLWEEEYARDDVYRFGIELRETGELIGSIDVVRYVDGVPEIGYVSGARFWGHGYMTEACNALLGLLKERGFETACIFAFSDNIGSNRVIQKCGFTFIRNFTIDIPQKGLFNVTANWYEKKL